MDPKERFHAIRRVLLYVLFLNWAVAGVKLLCGFMIGSASMTADGYHSFSDGSSNMIGLLGAWIASQPVDRNHPYGHKKFETLTSVAISGLLFLVCFSVVREGVLRLIHPVTPRVTGISFLVMMVTLAINVGVMVYETRKGKRLQSDVLLSDALHTRADIFTSFSVMVTLVGVRLGYPAIDPIASLVIAVFIALAAVNILKESSRVLSDAVAIPTEEIRNVVFSIKGTRECHKIRSRGRPDDIHMDLHVLVDPGMDVHRAHHLSYAIENKIKRNFPGVTDVVVHMEPLEAKKSRVPDDTGPREG